MTSQGSGAERQSPTKDPAANCAGVRAPRTHTPGPWRWFGNTKNHELYLATEEHGRVFVMNFVRWGMAGAQPRFQSADHFMKPAADLVTYEVPYRRDITGIDHPDARLIASAPDLLDALKAWERWYSEDSTEFNRDMARDAGLKAIAKATGSAPRE